MALDEGLKVWMVCVGGGGGGGWGGGARDLGYGCGWDERTKGSSGGGQGT